METHPDRPNDYEFLSLSLDDEFKTSTTFDFEPGVSNRIFFFMTPEAKKWRDSLEKSWTMVLIDEPSARDFQFISKFINFMRYNYFDNSNFVHSKYYSYDFISNSSLNDL